VHAFHEREIDEEAAVGEAPPRDVVAAAADGELEAGVATEGDRVGDVGFPEAARDQRGALVDQAVEAAPRLLVAVLAGAEDLTRERLQARQFLFGDCRHRASL
jgi:hypothetical protein